MKRHKPFCFLSTLVMSSYLKKNNKKNIYLKNTSGSLENNILSPLSSFLFGAGQKEGGITGLSLHLAGGCCQTPERGVNALDEMS